MTLVNKTFSSITDDVTIKILATEITPAAKSISLTISNESPITITLLHTPSDLAKNMWQYYDYYITW